MRKKLLPLILAFLLNIAMLQAAVAAKSEDPTVWSERHPVLHKIGRAVRKGFQTSEPVLRGLSYVGTVAYGIAPYIIRH